MKVESSVLLDCKFLRHHHCPRRKILHRQIRKPTKDLSPTLLDYSRLYAVVIPVIIQINFHFLKRQITYHENHFHTFHSFNHTFDSFNDHSMGYSLKGIINKVSLGDLSSGRAFDNGCTCFYSCQGVVNDLRGQKTDCFCNVSYYATKK